MSRLDTSRGHGPDTRNNHHRLFGQWKDHPDFEPHPTTTKVLQGLSAIRLTFPGDGSRRLVTQLALLKNEFGDLAVDSQLASSQSISGVRELLNGCICCNLVGQLSDALFELRCDVTPDRIIIETSGSAFPATLAMEVNRVAREHGGAFELDGVITVIDVENWKGYEDTSFTAKLQAKYTDLIVFNKWELVDERRFEDCLDRVGDLELQVAWVKSVKGFVDQDVIMGIDGAMIVKKGATVAAELDGQDHIHQDHQEEVEVLSVVLEADEGKGAALDLESFEDLLLAAPKDEIYRIKGILASSRVPAASSGESKASVIDKAGRGAATVGGQDLYVLNWAFGRWNYTALPSRDPMSMDGALARLTFILARGESTKWKRKLEVGDLIALEGNDQGARLKVDKIG